MEPRGQLRAFFRKEQGVGVIELVLVPVMLTSFVITFREQIITLLENIFRKVNGQSKEVH